MGIKNLKLDFETTVKIVQIGFSLAIMGYGVAYYTYDNQIQVIECNIDDSNVYTDSEGQTCCYFEPGEHVIKVSRNDAYYHKYETVDGYMINMVETKGWKCNNKVYYVNVEPVIAIGKTDKKGNITYNEFGTVTQPRKIK